MNPVTGEVMVGTPPVKVNLALSTILSPSWVESESCRTCFNVSGATFNPNHSITYAPMLANDPICKPLYLSPDPSNQFCTYNLSFWIDEFTSGTFGYDIFTTTKQQGQAALLAFGLGVDNKMNFTFSGHGANPIAGFVGLARDHPSSIINQLSVRQFSYCLPHFEDDAGLLLGEDADSGGSVDLQRTPIMGSSSDFYYIQLDEISLNGTRLPIPQEVLKRNGKGMVIDCVAPYTALVADAYDVVYDSLKSYFLETTGQLPLPTTRSGYDMCYDLQMLQLVGGGSFSGPHMAFHFFGEATLELDDSTIFQEFSDINEVCFMMFRVDYIGVPNFLGTLQQQNRRFFYNVDQALLSFSTGAAC